MSIRGELSISWFKWVAALAAVALAGCVSNSEIGNVNEEITEAESDLVFNGPGLEGGFRRILKGYAGNYYTRRTVAFYGPQKGNLPFANIVMLETSESNRYFPKDTVAEALDGWTRYSENKPELGDVHFGTNSLGAADFAAYEDEGAQCLAFTQLFGGKITARGRRSYLAGFYCRSGDVPISEAEGKEIVGAIGHRDYGDVPLSDLRRQAQTTFANLSGQYELTWPGMTQSSPVEIVFVGGQEGVFHFKSGTAGYCDGDYKFEHVQKNEDTRSVSGAWSMECDQGAASGELLLSDIHKDEVAVHAVGRDDNNREILFSK